MALGGSKGSDVAGRRLYEKRMLYCSNQTEQFEQSPWHTKCQQLVGGEAVPIAAGRGPPGFFVFVQTLRKKRTENLLVPQNFFHYGLYSTTQHPARHLEQHTHSLLHTA